MGIYLNPGDEKFIMAQRSPIYVDKSGMIAYLNHVLRTEERFVCVSRPRRFGKSMAANMIAAYYGHTVDTGKTFQGMNITNDASFQEHTGKYDVIHLNMQDFLSRTRDMQEFLNLLQKRVLRDLLKTYPNVDYFNGADLAESMSDIYENTRRPFVIVIDEWDCIFIEYKDRKDWQEKYLDFLRSWLKDKAYVGLAYMTGILPIKKYGTHSALNMFREFSMTDAGPLAEYTGFTEAEVRKLCKSYQMDFEECKAWYDGYHFNEAGSIYSPCSVVQSMLSHKYSTYWNQTETFEALKVYIDMNYDGLREAVIALMAGE
ncbi:MAG: AAA family ATPase, partial [Selenomonadaceae bacterium]|nr:AAA family ATPase [Selenomonadaceae bacterium]